MNLCPDSTRAYSRDGTAHVLFFALDHLVAESPVGEH